MVSALDSGASGPGSSPGRGQCVVFLGNCYLLGKPSKIAGQIALASRAGEVEILLATSCYRNWDKLRQL